MKTLFRDLKVGDKFKLNPYEPWWSEKASDADAFVDVSSDTYKRIAIRADTEVIKSTLNTNYYDIQIILEGNLVGEGMAYGNSAMEAFENAMKSGSVYIPSGHQVEIVASIPGGYAINFEVATF